MVSSALVGPGQTQATGTGLDGAALNLKVIAAAVAVPSAPANGVIVDRTYAELAAGLAPVATAEDQVWLADAGQQAIEARLQAAGVSIASSSTTAAAAAAFARQGPALSSVLFLADAAAATLLAAGAAILDLYLSARRRRYEYAALSASGVSFRTLRRAVLHRAGPRARVRHRGRGGGGRDRRAGDAAQRARVHQRSARGRAVVRASGHPAGGAWWS